jgi:CDGSH-type Zn-finger protein
VLVARDGPTYLRGDIEVLDDAGEVCLRDTRVALCRCGLSRNKPLCDNTHRAAGFHDPGTVQAQDSVQDAGATGSALRVIPERDGPIELSGPFALASADRKTVLAGTSTWLCRCGHSKSKPFCDNSHKQVGFKSG